MWDSVSAITRSRAASAAELDTKRRTAPMRTFTVGNVEITDTKLRTAHMRMFLAGNVEPVVTKPRDALLTKNLAINNLGLRSGKVPNVITATSLVTLPNTVHRERHPMRLLVHPQILSGTARDPTMLIVRESATKTLTTDRLD